MAEVYINEATLTAISDAIRAKTGKSDLLNPGDWVDELDTVKPSGKYLWSKKVTSDGDVIGYVVAYYETKYPDGATAADGYYYERVE